MERQDYLNPGDTYYEKHKLNWIAGLITESIGMFLVVFEKECSESVKSTKKSMSRSNLTKN